MHSIHFRTRRFAAGVAALAGFVDAYGFLSTQGFFVSFMSGNSTRLAVGVGEWSAQVAIPAAIIASFIAGVVGGEWIGLRFDSARARNVLLLSAAWLAIAAAMAVFVGPLACGAASAIAMGATNTVFSREDRLPVGLTYMTGTLVLIGHAIVLRVMRGVHSRTRLLVAHWLALISGGVAGALAFRAIGHEAAWIAAAIAALLATAVPSELPRAVTTAAEENSDRERHQEYRDQN